MRVDSSVVVGLILHFRTPAATSACVHSMVAEGIRSVVLVDNSADGGTSLREMSGDLRILEAIGIRIDVVDPSVNLGFAAGVNRGLARARENGAKAVFLLNSDAVVERGALEHMLTGMGNADVVVPRVRSKRGVRSVRLGGFYHRATALNLRTQLLGCMPYISGCCMLLRTDTLKLPLFDECFFFYCEDVAFSYSLHKCGVRVVECVDATIIHAGSGSAKEGSFFYEYHINRGHWLLAHKLASGRLQGYLFTAARCVTLPLRASVRSIRFRSIVPWRALCAATADVIRGRCRSFTPLPK